MTKLGLEYIQNGYIIFLKLIDWILKNLIFLQCQNIKIEGLDFWR